MTTAMIVSLAALVLMIVMIMSNKFTLGVPPLVAICLLVLTGVSTIQDAFAGFINSNVIMIAGFLAIMAAVQKTSLMGKIKVTLAKLAEKGGFKAYVLLLIVVMLGASVLAGVTGYYVMILAIVATIPYSKKLPNSKLLMPLAFATGRGLIPIGVAFFMGLSNSLLETAGLQPTITMAKFGIMVLVMSVGFLIWSLIAYKILPDHDISEGANSKSVTPAETTTAPTEPALPKWKEICTYIAFLVSVGGMMFAGKIGEAAYIIPGLATAFVCLIGVFNFKEVRNHLFSPLIIMTASVIGIANALASSGLTALVGDAVAKAMGANMSPFVLILIFCLLISTSATLTGSSIGSLFIFAPIGIATAVSLGINPIGIAAAMAVSAWGGGYMPIDGLPAMAFGMGKYKLSQFFLYTIPMYLFQIVALVIGALIAFPA